MFLDVYMYEAHQPHTGCTWYLGSHDEHGYIAYPNYRDGREGDVKTFATLDELRAMVRWFESKDWIVEQLSGKYSLRRKRAMREAFAA